MSLTYHAGVTNRPTDPWQGGPADADVGVLLVHGFTGNPASLLPLGEHLAAAGFRVDIPLLPGHGTTWQDMARTTWPQWYGEAERAYVALAATCRAVVVVGLSMGGSLALRLAERHDVAGVVLVNPSVGSRDPKMKLLPVLSRIVPSLPAIGDDIAKPGVSEHAYDRTPLRAAVSLMALWRDVTANLRQVTAPVLLFRSVTDHVVDPSSAVTILRSVSSAERTEHLLQRSYHVATLDHDADEIATLTEAFIRRHT